jgi:hypothetical protein
MAARKESLLADRRVENLLRDQGWKTKLGEPEAWLKEHTRSRVQWMLEQHERDTGFGVTKFSDVRRIVADRLKVNLLEIETDRDLQDHVHAYCSRGELAFKEVENEMSSDVEGAIVRLKSPHPGERKFVAIIDARGERSAARYFTGCHEIGHPFLEPQLDFGFRCRSGAKSALERAVDIVAAEIAFHRPLAQPRLRRYVPTDLTYDGVHAFWRSEADFASRTATFVAAMNLWGSPAMYVEAAMRTARHGRDSGMPSLRIVTAIPNEAARGMGIVLPPQFRVPSVSAMKAAFETPNTTMEQDEDMGWWKTSDGSQLKARPVRVGARRVGNAVVALMRF